MSLDDLTVRDLFLLSKLPSTTSLRILASTLGIEPSSLSRMVKGLEDALAVKLLNRSNQGVTATSEARLLARKAGEICEALKDLPLKASSAKRPFQRFINFGSRGFVNTFVAPQIVEFFADESDHKELGFRFFDLSPDESLMAARHAVVDALVGFEEVQLGKSWQQFQVGKLFWRLYARPRNPVVGLGGKIDLSAFRVGHHCAFDGKSAVLNDGLLFSSLGIRQVGHGAQSAQTALAIAAATDQLACVPEIVAASFVADRKIVEVPIRDLSISTPVYLAIHTERIQQGELRMLRKVLQSKF